MQEQAARILRVADRTFRRYINRYTDEGLEGLCDAFDTGISPSCTS
ncbi:MAG: helix-turn-helix domain-containing protein [Desulfobacterales bacterium]|nr:helix-turn-helix domain-containing protein [Desulfobacterales bacterium]